MPQLSGNEPILGLNSNFFKMFLYALKFDMDRLFACIEDMGGFLNSNMTHKSTLYILFCPHFI
jgi:hypothetical protein